ncbi:MAG TPA: LysR family transcriptional regulator [Candidatus Competibacteraceae bacterium]|nr:LysR family transcriptional regulator [Candidatus Competibacteraceae bacterium]
MFLELRHLRTLAMLRDTGSIAAAAERLHLTQSALSHQTKALEDYYGLPLFIRKSRPIRFTPAGQRLLALADQVLPALAATERDLGRLAGGRAGRLHIAMECHSCFDWLMPTLDTFREHWPEVELDILMGYSFAGLQTLTRGEADLMVTSDPVDDPAIHYEPLFRYQGMLALAKHHPLTARDWIEPEDLRDQTLIVYPVGREKLDVFKYFLDPAGVEPARLRPTELTVMIMQLVASGRGVAALPNWVLGEYLARDYVAARPLGQESFWCTLYAAIRAEDATLPFMQDFMVTARETAFRVLNGIRPAVSEPERMKV